MKDQKDRQEDRQEDRQRQMRKNSDQIDSNEIDRQREFEFLHVLCNSKRYFIIDQQIAGHFVHYSV